MKEIRDTLARLRADIRDGDLTVGELLDGLGDRSHALAVILCCAVFLAPIPLPGLSSVFGAFVVVFGGCLAMNKPIRLPAKWNRKILPARLATALLDAADWILVRAAAWVRLRTVPAVRTNFERWCGAGIVVCGIILALPLPPGGNIPPALGGVLLAIAVLAQDGVFAICGTLVMMLSGGIVAAVAYAAWRALGAIRG